MERYITKQIFRQSMESYDRVELAKNKLLRHNWTGPTLSPRKEPTDSGFDLITLLKEILLSLHWM